MYASRENAQANSLCQLISIMPVAEANAKQGHVAAQAAEAKFQSYRIKLPRLKVMQTVKSRNLFAAGGRKFAF